jgi:hypothetical protein
MEALGEIRILQLDEKKNFIEKFPILVIKPLDPDPYLLKIVDLDPHQNQCGSTTLVRA